MVKDYRDKWQGDNGDDNTCNCTASALEAVGALFDSSQGYTGEDDRGDGGNQKGEEAEDCQD